MPKTYDETDGGRRASLTDKAKGIYGFTGRGIKNANLTWSTTTSC